MECCLWLLIPVVVIVAVRVLLALMRSYNDLVALHERVEGSWSQIDVHLLRRHDLIPNLVAIAERYGVVERDTLQGVVRARNAAIGSHDMAEREAAEGFVRQSAERLFALMEAYPDLKSSRNFVELQSSWEATEDRIEQARNGYNHAVTAYNTALRQFPGILTGSLFMFAQAAYFEPQHVGRPALHKPPAF